MNWIRENRYSLIGAFIGGAVGAFVLGAFISGFAFIPGAIVGGFIGRQFDKRSLSN